MKHVSVGAQGHSTLLVLTTAQIAPWCLLPILSAEDLLRRGQACCCRRPVLASILALSMLPLRGLSGQPPYPPALHHNTATPQLVSYPGKDRSCRWCCHRLS